MTAIPYTSSFSSTPSKKSGTDSQPSIFQGRKWDWVKRAALTVAIVALSLTIAFVAGISSPVIFSVIGAASGITAFFCSLFLFKLSPTPTGLSSQSISLHVEEGEAYDPKQYVDRIKEAIEEGKTLTWKGKVDYKTDHDDVYIIPNVHLGHFKNQPNQHAVQFKPLHGPRVIEPDNKNFIGNNLDSPNKQYLCHVGSYTGKEKGPIGLVNYVQDALRQVKQILFTGDILPKAQVDGTTPKCGTRKKGDVGSVNASLLAVIYLKHLTKLDEKIVLSYMEKLLNCKYADMMSRPTRDSSSYTFPISQYLE